MREAAWGQLAGRPARETLQLDLQGLLSAFQGSSGTTPYGLDSVRLLDSLTAADDAGFIADHLSLETLNYLRQFGDNRVWLQLQPLIGKLRQFRSDLSGYVDTGFDKSAFINDLEETVGLLVETATWPDRADLNLKDFTRRVADFKSAPIVELVEKSTIVDEAAPDQLPKVLNALGSLDLSNIDRTKAFLETAEAIVGAAQVNVDRAYAARDQANPDRIADEIDALLSSIVSAQGGRVLGGQP